MPLVRPWFLACKWRCWRPALRLWRQKFISCALQIRRKSALGHCATSRRGSWLLPRVRGNSRILKTALWAIGRAVLPVTSNSTQGDLSESMQTTKAAHEAQTVLCKFHTGHFPTLSFALHPGRWKLSPQLAKDLRLLAMTDGVVRHTSKFKCATIVGRLRGELAALTVESFTKPADVAAENPYSSGGSCKQPQRLSSRQGRVRRPKTKYTTNS